jgi:hypothetical protein
MKECDVYSNEEKSVILELLRFAEETGPKGLAAAFVEIKEDLGRLSFTELEEILRKNDMEIGIIAIPVEKAPPPPGYMIADANNLQIKRDFVAQPVWSREEAEWVYDLLEMNNDPLVNIANLAEAGVMVPIPGTEEARRVKALFDNVN